MLNEDEDKVLVEDVGLLLPVGAVRTTVELPLMRTVLWDVGLGAPELERPLLRPRFGRPMVFPIYQRGSDVGVDEYEETVPEVPLMLSREYM